ncbi:MULTISPECIES: polyhydroxyalkanoate synthesis repressor PhaR [Acidiphilium]|jgi:polyhydroxyalkanoate synthesis repressor PhaR|uniref:Polyhydroxyalkonate synthesis repressor, PhaR n=2 Tax=Acidiphilium TaxID=522 RepID=A5G0R5_ACICJ|nr:MULTISPECIES: polyhydroxyalkanoate synthesis repressor PhaR [Acidiphilium]MBU6356747.1 polyhydroxyalkanoate synthesis repressor PhaR [Rhodospirillales bacterium]ABQ31447.1 polyhydroxyalkonate synthesis repressor, PhaR [Acidiphilium cryptum JF-5]KDM67141.1 polyhydroxyalkonate synthesis repressor, PhaR [Acidiphilium sp. JA12-A1]MBS3024082.1 polyhydroxyalkanoate synthesis repressor PhaR [Acidiphilium multivorum]MDE2326508.1 polyhydroxyalkanoate synthesis repressor PhaR [Rhodospirillales bacter
MPQTPDGTKPIVIKKYANRRLYNTESSTYITLETLSEMVREGRDFEVFDAKTGEDITRAVLTQIIVEEESKVGQAMLPTNFLRQLIGLYGNNMQGVVPRFLEQAMSQFSRQQSQMRAAMQQTMGNFIPPGMEEIGRQNMAMMERAMSLFSPFGAQGEASAAGADDHGAAEEIETLRAEVERLQAELAALRARAPKRA